MSIILWAKKSKETTEDKKVSEKEEYSSEEEEEPPKELNKILEQLNGLKELIGGEGGLEGLENLLEGTEDSNKKGSLQNMMKEGMHHIKIGQQIAKNTTPVATFIMKKLDNEFLIKIILRNLFLNYKNSSKKKLKELFLKFLLKKILFSVEKQEKSNPKDMFKQMLDSKICFPQTMSEFMFKIFLGVDIDINDTKNIFIKNVQRDVDKKKYKKVLQIFKKALDYLKKLETQLSKLSKEKRLDCFETFCKTLKYPDQIFENKNYFSKEGMNYTEGFLYSKNTKKKIIELVKNDKKILNFLKERILFLNSVIEDLEF